MHLPGPPNNDSEIPYPWQAMKCLWGLIRTSLIQCSCFCTSGIPAAFPPKMIGIVAEVSSLPHDPRLFSSAKLRMVLSVLQALSGWVAEQNLKPNVEGEEEKYVPVKFAWDTSRAFSDMVFADDNRTAWSLPPYRSFQHPFPSSAFNWMGTWLHTRFPPKVVFLLTVLE